MLGSKVALPFYVTATALGKLGNPEGEVVLTRAARKVCFYVIRDLDFIHIKYIF